MAVFQHYYWGYQLDYPDNWVQRTEKEVTAFAMHQSALNTHYDGPHQGYLLIRPEFNPYQKPIQPLWQAYLAKIAVMRAAKKVGSAPFKVGVLEGFEAELLLPQRQNQRLWMGILSAGSIILHLMVAHRKTEKETFQPIVSRMVASLRFTPRVDDIHLSEEGIPLPRDTQPAPVAEIYPPYEKASRWEAYRCPSAAADAMQIFFLREAPFYGWEHLAFYPYPNQDPKRHFASLIVSKNGLGAAIHILPQKQGSAVAIQYVE